MIVHKGESTTKTHVHTGREKEREEARKAVLGSEMRDVQNERRETRRKKDNGSKKET